MGIWIIKRFLDLGWIVLTFLRHDYNLMDSIPQKPANLEQMIAIARKLAQPFPHVRVDLYNVNGKIYFGELQLYTNGNRFILGASTAERA